MKVRHVPGRFHSIVFTFGGMDHCISPAQAIEMAEALICATPGDGHDDGRAVVDDGLVHCVHNSEHYSRSYAQNLGLALIRAASKARIDK